MKGRKDVSVEYTENVFDDESRRDCDGKIGGEKPRAGEYDAVSDISIDHECLPLFSHFAVRECPT